MSEDERTQIYGFVTYILQNTQKISIFNCIVRLFTNSLKYCTAHMYIHTYTCAYRECWNNKGGVLQDMGSAGITRVECYSTW